VPPALRRIAVTHDVRSSSIHAAFARHALSGT
jgi:hypothetical protein